MKTFFVYLIIFFFFSIGTFAQINLVPNPSFEQYIGCPTGTNEMDSCKYWHNFGESPDYFNTCTGWGGPPYNYGFGYQYPHTGNAMAGLATYEDPAMPAGPNYREFIGVQLTQTLQIGLKYYLSFFVNLSSIDIATIATNKIGCRFSTVPYDSCCPPPINNWAHLFSNSIIKDTLNWTKISGSVVADSAYQYLIIGNFFDDNHTDTLDLSTYNQYAYYYIDDICVSTDSIYNDLWTDLSENSQNNNMKIFPNPVTDNYINIENIENTAVEITIYDATGKEVFNKNAIPSENKISLNIGIIMKGYYIINFKQQSKNFNSPLIIN